MKMDDPASVGRSPEFSQSRQDGIERAIDSTVSAYALGSAVAHAHILAEFVRSGAARLSALLTDQPALTSQDGGWALGAARMARADLAQALAELDRVVEPLNGKAATSWENALHVERAGRVDKLELDRELLEILGIEAHARRYIAADDLQRAWLLQQSVLDIVRQFTPIYMTPDDLRRLLKTFEARINRSPPTKALPSMPADAFGDYDDDCFDD